MDPRYDANCDLVIEMQEMGIGVEEVLQYAHGVFSRDEIRSLILGLGQLVDAPVPVHEESY